MKKLFVAVLAIAALAACNKEEVNGPALDSKNKAVQITIVNGNGGTRAEGGVTAAGKDQEACAEASDLVVLFSDGTNVLHKSSLTGHDAAEDATQYIQSDCDDENTYVWHNVPYNVTKIAVVRTNGTEADAFTTLAEYSTLAENEDANIARSLEEIVLYGESALTDTGETHVVDNTNYHIWKADVTVAPKFARFEVHSIKCKDLGEANVVSTDLDYGFDELDIVSLTWNGKYTAKDIAGTIYGTYNPAEVKADANRKSEGRSNELKPETGVWSWNVLPEQGFTGMQVALKAYAYDYALAEDARNLTLNVTGLSTKEDLSDVDNKFEAENIYTINLVFEEGNIMDPEGLCVKVNVTINPWTVNTRYPIFG